MKTPISKVHPIQQSIRDLLPSNAVPRSEAEGLHCMSIIVLIARIIEMTLRNKFLRIGEIGGRIAGGQVTDGRDCLTKSQQM
jgi:hypothetical protein